jgi:hypothetical protein
MISGTFRPHVSLPPVCRSGPLVAVSVTPTHPQRLASTRRHFLPVGGLVLGRRSSVEGALQTCFVVELDPLSRGDLEH